MHPQHWVIQGKKAPLSAISGPIDVVVGIARPEGFLCTLLDLGLELRSVTVIPDHGKLPPLPSQCVVSEKDAARLPRDSDLCVLIATLHIEGGDRLLSAIRNLETPC